MHQYLCVRVCVCVCACVSESIHPQSPGHYINGTFAIDSSVLVQYLRGQPNNKSKKRPSHLTLYCLWCINRCIRLEQTFEGSNLRMLNATFECLYIMECVGNLCTPRPLHEQVNLYI